MLWPVSHLCQNSFSGMWHWNSPSQTRDSAGDRRLEQKLCNCLLDNIITWVITSFISFTGHRIATTSSHQSQNKNFIDTSQPDSQANRNRNVLLCDYFQTNKDWIGENHIINNSYFMDSLVTSHFTSHIRKAREIY